MKNKIALEEHFATEDTLEDSYDLDPPSPDSFCILG